MVSKDLICCKICALVFVLLTFPAARSQQLTTNWCNVLSCSSLKDQHVMCLYPRNGSLSKCPKRHSTMNAELRANILRLHNILRNSLAGGTGRFDTDLPQASSMMLLQWDYELELVAQRNTDNCILGNDKCRNVDRFQVGQHFAIFRSPSVPESSLEAIEQWTNEYKYWNSSNISKHMSSDSSRHFTQCIWSSTRAIGCSETTFYDEKVKMNARYLVCNYGPKGNIVGSEVYTPGEPCSRCPMNTKCSYDQEYPNLCGGVNIRDEPYGAESILQNSSLRQFSYSVSVLIEFLLFLTMGR